jgi:hypothetical protein
MKDHRLLRQLTWDVFVVAFIPAFILAAFLPGKRHSTGIFGSFPVLTLKYWSQALNQVGIQSMTIVDQIFSINSSDDFDRMLSDFAWSWLPLPIRRRLGGCMALLFVLRYGSVLHTPFSGFAFSGSSLWRLEGWLLRRARIPVVILPVGGDIYLYSRILDPSIRYGLLADYPGPGRHEGRVAKKVQYWVKHADIVLSGLMLDGIGRWDVTTPQYMVVNTDEWKPPLSRTCHNGSSGPVTVVHCPNHRHVKGTEFIVNAVTTLCDEGLDVELLLLEGIPNDEVQNVLQRADILVDQLVLLGYALSAIEGMGAGLPVLANLDNDLYTQLYRRYSFLDECPILSTTPETVTANLRALVTSPDLRQKLGGAGREYATKYHSYSAAQYLFSSIYKHLSDPDSIDILWLYHPLLGDLCRSGSPVVHPLVRNRLVKSSADKQSI